MIPEDMQYRLNELVEEVESLCDEAAKEFWQDVDNIQAGGVAYDNNELTKEVLNALEHVFTRCPKD